MIILTNISISIGGYERFAALKSTNKKLKTLLSIGGWNEGSRRFSSISKNQDQREEFSKNVVEVQLLFYSIEIVEKIK